MSWSTSSGRLTRHDDRLGVAVVGYGPWGANHTRAVGRSSRLRLAAVVEQQEARQAEAASTGAAIYATLDEAMQNPAVVLPGAEDEYEAGVAGEDVRV